MTWTSSTIRLGPTKVNSGGIAGAEVIGHVGSCGIEVEQGGWGIERGLIRTSVGYVLLIELLLMLRENVAEVDSGSGVIERRAVMRVEMVLSHIPKLRTQRRGSIGLAARAGGKIWKEEVGICRIGMYLGGLPLCM
jgi:hypothetical protein